MRNRSKLLLLALTAALALSIAANAANANRSIEATAELITGTAAELTFFSGENELTVICPVTLMGSLHRRIAKVSGELAGFINEGRVGEGSCRGGGGASAATASILAETFPWHILYNSFTGRLPTITNVLLVVDNGAFLIRVTFLGIRVGCLYKGAVGGNTEAATSPIFERIRVLETSRIPLFRTIEGAFCPRNGQLRGNFALRPSVTIRLI